MLIAISGTPGTGKTAAAKILAKKLKARLINTNYLVKKYRIKTAIDRKRKTCIVDTKKLAAAVKKESDQKIIFEGHLSHFVGADMTIILRTSPQELEKRLKRKGWSKRKITENVEAEAIGVISSEADALEIDTTGKNPSQTAGTILKLLNNYSRRKQYGEKIDWTDAYKNYLKKKSFHHRASLDVRREA